MFQVPTHLTEALRFLDCVSSTVHRSPYCQTVLNADGRVYTVTCVRLFYLFSNTSFCNFSHLRIVFLLLFLFFLSFFSFISSFTLTSFIVLNFILLRASLDTTISLSVLIFIRLNPRATSGFFHLMYHLTLLPPPPPLSSCYHVYFVHVGSVLLTSSLVKSQFSFRLMSSPLWSGANVCSPQSSHYKCSCKLEELPPSLADIITAFCRKPSMFESSLLPSTVWEWIKLSPRVHLRRESKMAAGQSTDSTESVPAILDVDDEKTLVKSFDETIIKKG